MPSITDLNATNASVVLQYGKYTDFNIWITVLLTTLGLMVISRCLRAEDDVGRFLVAVLAFVFSIAGIWGSLGLAYINHVEAATVVLNGTTTNYIFPMQQVIAANWITFLCIIITIFAFINALDIFIVMMQRPEVDEKKKRGRGINI